LHDRDNHYSADRRRQDSATQAEAVPVDV
jgi:hypothetical protein